MSHVIAAKPLGASTTMSEVHNALHRVAVDRFGAAAAPQRIAFYDTALIPQATVVEEQLDDLIGAAAETIGTDLLATVVTATPSDHDSASSHARELLTVAIWLDKAAGVYRFRDLALEYQLSRPGRAHDLLVATIDLLGTDQILDQTLTSYIANNADPVATAVELSVNSRTLDDRLDHIELLTRLNPRSATDLWRLGMARIAHAINNTHSEDDRCQIP
ncbi:helix-turn-helix domain-containing protein [Nocardia sp. NPDC055053]